LAAKVVVATRAQTVKSLETIDMIDSFEMVSCFLYAHNIPLQIHNVKYIISWLLIKYFYES